MIIRFNNIELNKYELLHLINTGKKFNAIKLLKDKTQMDLKECKDLIDNLSDDPYFYDGKNHSPQKSFIEDYKK